MSLKVQNIVLYVNVTIVTVINTTCCMYSNSLLVMNIRNMYRIDYWNKLGKKSAPCWSVLSTYFTMHDPQNVQNILTPPSYIKFR